jgi:SAM-dependent methyltransferase
VHAVVADALALPLREASLDAIVIVNFLERALFPHLAVLLRPGGRLIVETFTTRHLDLVAAGRARGPRNPAYMLAPRELPRLVAPLMVDEYTEVEAMDGPGARAVARMVAVK